jgi:hypothetical protein
LAEKATTLIIAVQNQMTSVTGVPSSPTFERSVARFTKSVPLSSRIREFDVVTTLAIQDLAGDCGHGEDVCRIEMDDPLMDVSGPPSADSGLPRPFGYVYQSVRGTTCNTQFMR